jgi:CheY-like chemotaxis protein
VTCKSLVAAMGGVIGLESTPGKGSLFWYELSFKHGDAVAAVGRQTSEPIEVRPLVVPVADDIAANRELLGEILRRNGHTVHFAEDGAAAVALVTQQPVDVVLMDIQMQVMHGMEATRGIRSLPAPAGRAPILALTANVVADDRERYIACGMDRCLTKPVIWPELFAALAAVTGGEAAPVAPPSRAHLPSRNSTAITVR